MYIFHSMKFYLRDLFSKLLLLLSLYSIVCFPHSGKKVIRSCKLDMNWGLGPVGLHLVLSCGSKMLYRGIEMQSQPLC